MKLEIEATYENGVLKLDKPLPLQENERVRITIQPAETAAGITYGLIGWTGDPETVRRIAGPRIWNPGIAMNLGAILAGETVFVDANTFVYALAPEPTLGPPCYQFLERIRRKEIAGFTSAQVLSDVAHRLMSLEAAPHFAWPYQGIANRMKRHPAEIAKLHAFRKALDEIVAIGIRILPVTAHDVLLAGDLSRQHGVLSGDGLILAIMQSQGLTRLASNDADFDRVPGIIRYAPL